MQHLHPSSLCCCCSHMGNDMNMILCFFIPRHHRYPFLSINPGRRTKSWRFGLLGEGAREILARTAPSSTAIAVPCIPPTYIFPFSFSKRSSRRRKEGGYERV
jgi:hypothetical protein